ncbi:MAG: hypothetical protein HOE90_20975 [Bacteriovoracaceae bacterium]|jgi:23S rRNA (cytidine2498-2'-O)-methyltransferase|nr:hypothetical protein [Bacteriovoracaceae bacterium]
MSDQFLFFCVNLGNENLLKEEIRVFYPELTLSYSRKGFITYKNKGVVYDLSSISQLEATFATRAGICLGKAKPDQLNETVTKSCQELELDFDQTIIHSFSVGAEFQIDAAEIFNREVNNYSANGKTVIDLITLGENEVWFGVHIVAAGTTRFPNSNPSITTPADSPSASYTKLAQIASLFSIKLDERDSWLDFGSAPGGASHFLLNRGHKVWGIDTAKMAASISAHKNYHHIKCSVQDLTQEALPEGDIHWVHADLNLNPFQAIKEVLRLCKKYNYAIKGMIFTVQVVKLDYVKNIEAFEDLFYDWGFTDIISRQVPAHKQEYVIIASK